MSLKRNILDLRKRKEIVLQGGGEDAIKKQAAMGKLTARERIESILDKGSFHEYDMFVEHQSKDFDMDKKVLHGDGVVIGTGTVYGEPVAIYAQDFTVAGGSFINKGTASFKDGLTATSGTINNAGTLILSGESTINGAAFNNR